MKIPLVNVHFLLKDNSYCVFRVSPVFVASQKWTSQKNLHAKVAYLGPLLLPLPCGVWCHLYTGSIRWSWILGTSAELVSVGKPTGLVTRSGVDSKKWGKSFPVVGAQKCSLSMPKYKITLQITPTLRKTWFAPSDGYSSSGAILHFVFKI